MLWGIPECTGVFLAKIRYQPAARTKSAEVAALFRLMLTSYVQGEKNACSTLCELVLSGRLGCHHEWMRWDAKLQQSAKEHVRGC